MQPSSYPREGRLSSQLRTWRSIAITSTLIAAALGVAVATDERWSYVVWGNVAQWVAGLATSAAVVFGAGQIRFLYRQAHQQLTAERNRGFRLATSIAAYMFSDGMMHIYSRHEFGFDDLRVRFDREDPLWFFGTDSSPREFSVEDEEEQLLREVVRAQFKERDWRNCRIEFLMLDVWFGIDLTPGETALRPVPMDRPSLHPKNRQQMLHVDRR